MKEKIEQILREEIEPRTDPYDGELLINGIPSAASRIAEMVEREKITVWIARDNTGDPRTNQLCVFRKKPVWDFDFNIFVSPEDYFKISGAEFSQIKNGECYSAQIVLGEKI